ncbi:hypothetical protein [Hymenobacter sp. B81]|uniref:hypothetical protein n=1 Tax=Hymenobacter sp. B81 TaxID=3344878 RepID=UPI0037DD86B9
MFSYLLRGAAVAALLACGLSTARAQSVNQERFVAARDSVLSEVAAVRQLLEQHTLGVQIRTPAIGFKRRIVKSVTPARRSSNTPETSWRRVVRHLPGGLTIEKYQARLNGKVILREQRINGQLAWVWVRRYANGQAANSPAYLAYEAKLIREGYVRIGRNINPYISNLYFRNYAAPVAPPTL